jgi:hypothetical protein
LPSPARSAEKSAMNIRFRCVAAITVSSIASATRLHGGPASTSIRFRSPSRCGDDFEQVQRGARGWAKVIPFSERGNLPGMERTLETLSTRVRIGPHFAVKGLKPLYADKSCQGNDCALQDAFSTTDNTYVVCSAKPSPHNAFDQ